jgi:lysophospholipid acyltransferase (LPLAT)-like uncharacterized protein
MKTYTVVGIYLDGEIANEIIVDHVRGNSVKGAVTAFYADSETRRDGCSIITVLEGEHMDRLFDVVESDGPVSYDVVKNLVG